MMTDIVEPAQSTRISDVDLPLPRLQVKATLGDGLLDGAWWPESRDLGTQLRALADGWPEQHGRIARALYSEADWDTAPRRILSRGSIIAAGTFPHEDSHKIVLTMSGSRRRIELLVIPTTYSADNAQSAFKTATQPGSHGTAAEILHGLASPTSHER